MSEADSADLSPSLVASAQLDTSDEIGTVTDLHDTSTDTVPEDNLNASTDAVHSDQEVREEELNDNEDLPDINSKLSFKEESQEEASEHVTEQADQRNGSQGERIVESRSQDVSTGSGMRVSKQAVTALRPPAKPAEIKPVHIGDQKLRSKLKFDVVTAKVVEELGKKHVTYTIMMKRAGGEVQPAVISRRYNDFCYLYERILCTFHPSILGDFQFPKKVLIGNFKAEVITERTDAFHKFLNLIACSDKLLYSDYFHAFLCSDEQNEAVSFIKLGKFEEAAPLLETIFYIREKLVTISHVTVLECLIELVACLAAVEADENAFRYSLVAAQCLQLLHGHPEVDRVRVPFLKLASSLAVSLGHDPKPYNKQLSELRYSGVKTDSAPSLLEVIRDKYIHTATRTVKTW